MKKKDILKTKRKQRIRKKINGTAKRPRLTVYRSNTHIYAQLVDDENHKTLGSASDVKVTKKMNKVEKSKEVGKEIAQIAKKVKVTDVVFDRSGYKYHGRVKALAEAAREAGLKF